MNENVTEVWGFLVFYDYVISSRACGEGVRGTTTPSQLIKRNVNDVT